MSVSIPAGGRVCLRTVKSLKRQTRSFSSTLNREKHGPIATFPPTSSPQADEIINSFRENVFLPAHLRTPQRHLIYRKAFQHYLTGEEPIKVELPTVEPGKAIKEDGPKEEFTLRPLSKQRDEPRFTPAFHAILDQISGNPQDWHIIPNFLRELHIAGCKIRSGQVEKLVRRAASDGRIGMMVECFKRKDTGIQIRDAGIAQQMILGAHRQALGAGLDEKSLDAAIRHVSFVLLAIQDEAHISPSIREELDPRRLPETHGSALALFAARRWKWETENTEEKRAARAAAAESEVEAVTKEAASVENSEGEAPAEAAVGNGTSLPQDAYALGENDIKHIERHALSLLENSANAELEFDTTDLASCDKIINRWAPTWFGAQLTSRIEVVDADIRRRLKAAFDAEIDPAVQGAVARLKTLGNEEKGQRGIKLIETYSQHLA